MEQGFRRERGTNDVAVREGWPVTHLGKQVAAEKRRCRLFEKNSRFPVVRNMRRVDVTDALSAKIDDLTVCQLARRPVAEVVERDHAAERTVCDFGARGSGQELIHRTALVGLNVFESDPPQPL